MPHLPYVLKYSCNTIKRIYKNVCTFDRSSFREKRMLFCWMQNSRHLFIRQNYTTLTGSVPPAGVCLIVLGKGKVSPGLNYLSTTSWRLTGEWRYISANLGLGTIIWRRVVILTPRPLYSRGNYPQYPSYRRLGSPQDRFGPYGEYKISCPCRESNFVFDNIIRHYAYACVACWSRPRVYWLPRTQGRVDEY
jgi:hypothetical protein